MAYTYSDFKTYLKFILGQRSDVESVGGNLYGVWVNQAYKQLTTSYRFWDLQKNFYFPELETSSSVDTVDGTAYISTPTDCFQPQFLYDTTSNRRLIWINNDKYLAFTDRANTDAEGAPTQWTQRGGYLYLHPTPDAVYSITVYYRKIPAALSTDTSSTAISTVWDDAIVSLSAYIAYTHLRDHENAAHFKRLFLEGVAGMIGFTNEPQKDGKEFVHQSPLYRNYEFK